MDEKAIIDFVKRECKSYGKFSGEEYIEVLQKGVDDEEFMNNKLSYYKNQGLGTFLRKRTRPNRENYFQYCCERSGKPTGNKRGPQQTRANSCTGYISFKFYHGAPWKACYIRVKAEHTGHTFAPEEAKVHRLDNELLGYIEYLSLQGCTSADIVVKVGEWARVRGHSDMQDRTFFPTPQDISYCKRRTLDRTRLDLNDSASVQKLCTGPMRDDIIFFQNLSAHHNQPLMIVVQSQFMKDQSNKYAQQSTIFVDASYRGITSYGYAFYALVCRNEHGHGVPMAYVITSREDTETLTLAFTKVKEAGNGSGSSFTPR